MIYRLDIRNIRYVPFAVLAIPVDIAGPNPGRTPANRKKPRVEFFDLRHPECARGDEPGQFVASFDLSDIIHGSAGLALHGNSADWSMDGRSMRVIRDWLDVITDRGLFG